MNAAIRNPVLLAIDTTDMAVASSLVDATRNAIGGIKLGLEFFNRQGAAGVAEIAGNIPLFLDLKLHDIPNTVAGGIRAVRDLRPELLTIHASGGPEMMRAAREAADPATKIVAVTVLTSLDHNDLAAVGQGRDILDQVCRLADLAQQAGLDGVVCSPYEAAALRARCGPNFTLVVPGIRPAGAAIGDQKRAMGPRDAIEAGAHYLVIGRPITAAPDPGQAARAITAELGI